MNSKFRNLSHKCFLFYLLLKEKFRACSSVVSNLRSETRGSWFESGHQLYPWQRLSVCEADGKSGREELELVFLFPGCSVTGESQLKENPDKKRKGFFTFRRKNIGCWKRNLLKRNWRRRRRFVVVFQVCLAGSWYPSRDLVRFAQCKKRTKYSWRSVTFSKVTVFCFSKSNTSPWVFFTFFKLYKLYQIGQNITYRNQLIVNKSCEISTLFSFCKRQDHMRITQDACSGFFCQLQIIIFQHGLGTCVFCFELLSPFFHNRKPFQANFPF